MVIQKTLHDVFVKYEKNFNQGNTEVPDLLELISELYRISHQINPWNVTAFIICIICQGSLNTEWKLAVKHLENDVTISHYLKY